MTLERFEDWPSRLARFVESARGRKFAWGSHDCALFAADAIIAMTGEDLAFGLRGRYATQMGAAKALKRFAGGGLEETAEKIAAKWELQECPPLRAQRGDGVLFDGEAGPTLAVCVGEKLAAPSLNDGLAFLPLAVGRRAWRI